LVGEASQARAVSEASLTRGGILNFDKGDWYLHDAVTGDRLMGPFPGIVNLQRDPFSADGHCFCGIRGDPAKGFEGYNGLAIFSTKAGKVVADLPYPDGLVSGGCTFALDESTAAVLWNSAGGGSANSQSYIQLIDLPSGPKHQLIPLPHRPWAYIQRWDGTHLTVVTYEERNKDDSVGRRYTFQLCSDTLSDETEDAVPGQRHTKEDRLYWIKGPNRLIQVSIVPPGTRQRPAWRSRLDSWLGLRSEPIQGIALRVHTLDPATGKTRYEFPRWLGHPCVLSPDGRLLACANDNESVEVWATDPVPRWPIAALAGAATAVLVELVLFRLTRKHPESSHQAAADRT
jgi:hypothetical protein